MPPPGSDHVTAPGQDDACPDGCGPDHSQSITAQCLAQLVRHASKERLAHKTEVR